MEKCKKKNAKKKNNKKERKKGKPDSRQANAEIF